MDETELTESNPQAETDGFKSWWASIRFTVI